MNRRQKFFQLCAGILMLTGSILLVRNPAVGLEFIAGILAFSLLVYGLRMFFYYFSMARHMVGGKRILIFSVFLLDLSLFASSLNGYPRAFVVMYLLGYHAFSGLVNLMRGLEARRFHSPEWRPNVFHGSFDLLLALACLVFIRSVRVLVTAYSVTLAWSALLRILSAFRRTEVTYIGP